MPHTSLILIATVSLLLLIWYQALKNSRGYVHRGLIGVAGLLPAAMVCLILLSSIDKLGNLRISLEGFRFEMEGEEEILVGGSEETDHLYVRDLPPHFLRFYREHDQLVVEINQPSEHIAGTSGRKATRRFAAVRQSGQEPFHNAVPLSHGDEIHLGSGKPTLIFDKHNQRFDQKKEKGSVSCWPIPKRTTLFGSVKLPLYKNLAPGIRIYPLRYYGAEHQTKTQAPEQLRIAEEIIPGSFFCWSGMLNRTPYLVITDPKVTVTHRNQERTYEREIKRLDDGMSVHLSLHRIDYRDDRVTPKNGSSRAQDRRSFTCTFKNGTLDITLDTPGFVHIGNEETAPAKGRFKKRGKKKPQIMTLAAEGFTKVPTTNRMLLSFSSVGKGLGHELFSSITFPKKKPYQIKVTTHQGTKGYQYGEGILVGERSALKLRIYKMQLPVGLLVILIIFALTAAITGLDIRRHPIHFLLLSGLEFLLAFRILVAFEAAALDTTSLDGTWTSLITYATAVYILQAGIILYRQKWRPKLWQKTNPLLIVHYVMTLFFQIVVFTSVPVNPKGASITIGFTFIAPFIILGLFMLLDRLPLNKEPTYTSRQWLGRLALAMILLFLFRATTLILGGWKERMNLVVAAMAVSVYYTPAVLLLAAHLWQARTSLSTRALGLLYWGGLALLFVVTPFMARDMGTLLIFPIPILFLFFLASIKEPFKLRKLMFAGPMIVCVIVHILVPMAYKVGLANKQSGATERAALESETAAGALLKSRVDESHNDLRFWGLAAPEKVREIGTTDSESLALVMANLRSYAGRGALGEGYMGTELVSSLRATHLNDNVSAVHVIASYGWLGAAFYLLLVLVWSLAPLALMPGHSLEEMLPAKTAFGLMVMLTFSVSALYMFSANMEMLMFTGKNVYFLAATSLSDVTEGCLLVVLAQWAFNHIGVRRAV